jgi:hypothetical protein
MDLALADWGDSPNPDDPKTPASAVTLRLLVNDGKGNFTERASLPAPDGSTSTDVDFVDIDGDFDLDIVLTNRNGHSRIYRNSGSGAFTDVTASKSFPAKRGGDAISFNGEACDVDGDGDLDVFFDGGASGLADHDTQILINDGKGVFADESGDRVRSEPQSDDNQVKCADVDNDGDFDLVVASLSNRSEKLLLNDGSGHFKLGVLPTVLDPTLTLDFGDFDGDGRVDYMTGQGENSQQSFLNRIYKNRTAKADTRGPTFRAVETKPSGRVIRVAVSDAHTSETGQHVKEVALVVKSGADETRVAGRFIGGDIFRIDLPKHVADGATATVVATDRAGNVTTGPRVTLGATATSP